MINYTRYGHGPRKLLGVHGWFGNERSFAPLELSLDPAEFECAWLAHRGYGSSFAIQGRCDMAEMAADALAVADQLGWSTFSAIGHSMGGKAAQLVAAGAPDRVAKLVLVSPVSADPVPFDPPARALFEGAADSAEHRKIIVNHSTGGLLSAKWVDDIVAMSVERSRKDAFAAYFKSWADDDLSDVIKDIATATLVLAGAADPVITLSVCEYGFRQRYRNLVIEELHSSGHYPMDEVPLLLGAQVAGHLRK